MAISLPGNIILMILIIIIRYHTTLYTILVKMII